MITNLKLQKKLEKPSNAIIILFAEKLLLPDWVRFSEEIQNQANELAVHEY